MGVAIDTNGRNAVARGEFFLCLARAFLPPRGAEAFDGVTRYLADDLDTLNWEIEYPVHGPLAQLRESVAAVTDHASLLSGYSALFLAPPAPASLNAGVYVDGAIAGRMMETVNEWYRHFGLSRAADFRDLDDHVVLQLEFLALLFAQSNESRGPAELTPAQSFLGSVVQHWVTPFREAVKSAASGSNPGTAVYGALASILAEAVAYEISQLPQSAAAPAAG